MTDLTPIQRTTGTISKNDFIVCRKKAKPQRGGEQNRRPTPLMRLAQTTRQRKSERKKNKNVGGEKRKKNVVIIKDKSSELSMF